MMSETPNKKICCPEITNVDTESAKLCKRCHQPLLNLEVKVYSCPCGRTTKTASLPWSLGGVIELEYRKQLEVNGAVLESYFGVPQHEMVNDLISIVYLGYFSKKLILLHPVMMSTICWCKEGQ